MTIKNLTPHPITLITSTGEIRVIAPTVPAVRCAEVVTPAGRVDGITVIRKDLGELIGLPEPELGILFVVSLAAATAAWKVGRRDVLTIGETTRDESGRITGAKSLACSPDGF